MAIGARSILEQFEVSCSSYSKAPISATKTKFCIGELVVGAEFELGSIFLGI
jgi:hypothetical protein